MSIIERKRKKGTGYQVKVRDPLGAWYPSLTFSSREEACLEEARLLGRKRKGIAVVSRDARTYTLQDFWEVWSVENRTDVSRGWKISQDQMYRDYVMPGIGEKKLRDIDVPEIGKILTRVKDLGRSDQLRKHVYSLLRKMFADAVEYYEILSVSPVRPKFHRPRVAKCKRAFLHPAQAWELLDRVRGHYLGPAIWLQTLAALRDSEVQALRGQSLMYPLNQILICAAYNKKTKELQDFPKQQDWAYVPMVSALKEYLLGLGTAPGDFVATGASGRGMLSYTTYHRALKGICRKAGLPILTPHELRHTCTEIFVDAGASTEDVRRLLNHASLTATANYIHRTDERLGRIATNVVEMFPKRVPELGTTGDLAGSGELKEAK